MQKFFFAHIKLKNFLHWNL